METPRESRVRREQNARRAEIRRAVWSALERGDRARQRDLARQLQVDAAAVLVGEEQLRKLLPPWMVEGLAVDFVESAKTRALQIEAAIELYVDEAKLVAVPASA